MEKSEKEVSNSISISISKVGGVLCKRCKQTYNPASNSSTSCRFHPSFFVCRRHDDQKRWPFYSLQFCTLRFNFVTCNNIFINFVFTISFKLIIEKIKLIDVVQLKTLKRTQKIILASVNSMLMLEDTFVWSIDAMLKTLI